jgi:hypothetical protein
VLASVVGEALLRPFPQKWYYAPKEDEDVLLQHTPSFCSTSKKNEGKQSPLLLSSILSA